MAEYDLQPGESFVHKQQSVLHGGSSCELILTSQNLVLIKTVRKGLLGTQQLTQVFPLQQIKVYEGAAQAVLGKYGSTWPALDVYMEGGTEQFVFMTSTGFPSKKDTLFWAQKINQAVTGTRATMISRDASAADKVTGAVKDTVGVFKDALGLKSKAEVAAAAAVPVAGSCVSCGAPVSGIRGQAITCGYCDTPNQL